MLSKLSVRTKLTMLASVTGAAAALLACVSFVVSDCKRMRDAKVRELASHADAVAHHSAAVFAEGDAERGRHVLRSLKSQATLEDACLLNPDGTIVASFHPEMRVPPPDAPAALRGHRFSPDGIELFHPVVDQAGRPIGAVFLRTNMADLHVHFNDYLLIAGTVLLLSLSTAIAVSATMQRWLSRPILDLAATVRQITEHEDFSLRVHATTQDEISALYGSFNRMLEQIEGVQAELKQAHADLENRVRERTCQLVEEIGERQRIQEDLMHSRDAAEAANRAKSSFLANMSHEIRTPLNAILGFTDLLRRGADSDPEERYDFLDSIHRSGQHLLGLINDILDLSKIEAGQMEFERIRCAPHRIVSEVVSVMRVRAQEKGLKLDYHWTTPIPETIESDPSRLRQLLLNLIGNAIKFTERGAVEVVVRLETPAGGPQLVFDVIDTGIGVAPEQQEAIFAPFSQADSSVTRRFGGTGLGLSICRHIAHGLGGDIRVESAVGRGSVFTVRIAAGAPGPLRMLDHPASDVLHHVHQELAACGDLPAARVLVVEDGDTNRKLIRLVLERAGLRVTCVENGLAAIQTLAVEEFDVILMDMQMPVMDGYTAAGRLRAGGCQTPVIALTAHAMKGDQQKCLAAGCSDYLSKPIDPDLLLNKLRQLLAPRSTAESLATRAASSAPAPEEPLLSTLPLDDVEFLEIVAEFVERLRLRLVEMRAAADSHDSARLLQMAHWLKGAGGTAGYLPLSVAAERLEASARQGDQPGIEEHLAALEHLVARIALPTPT